MKLCLRSIVTSACAIVIFGLARDANADDVRFGANDVPSVFHVSKSENRNEVHYGIHLDDRCMPVPGAPVFAYWRELEKGPNELSPLLALERPAYGVARQQTLRGRVRLALRALPSRSILIETSKRDDGRCAATAVMDIAGQPARLDRVFAQIAWPAGVEYLVLEGTAADAGRGAGALRERVTP